MNRTDYPPEGPVDATALRFEAQLWRRGKYQEEGVVFSSFWTAMEFLA